MKTAHLCRMKFALFCKILEGLDVELISICYLHYNNAMTCISIDKMKKRVISTSFTQKQEFLADLNLPNVLRLIQVTASTCIPLLYCIVYEHSVKTSTTCDLPNYKVDVMFGIHNLTIMFSRRPFDSTYRHARIGLNCRKEYVIYTNDGFYACIQPIVTLALRLLQMEALRGNYVFNSLLKS